MVGTRKTKGIGEQEIINSFSGMGSISKLFDHYRCARNTPFRGVLASKDKNNNVNSLVSTTVLIIKPLHRTCLAQKARACVHESAYILNLVKKRIGSWSFEISIYRQV